MTSGTICKWNVFTLAPGERFVLNPGPRATTYRIVAASPPEGGGEAPLRAQDPSGVTLALASILQLNEGSSFVYWVDDAGLPITIAHRSNKP